MAAIAKPARGKEGDGAVVDAAALDEEAGPVAHQRADDGGECAQEAFGFGGRIAVVHVFVADQGAIDDDGHVAVVGKVAPVVVLVGQERRASPSSRAASTMPSAIWPRSGMLSTMSDVKKYTSAMRTSTPKMRRLLRSNGVAVSGGDGFEEQRGQPAEEDQRGGAADDSPVDGRADVLAALRYLRSE